MMDIASILGANSFPWLILGILFFSTLVRATFGFGDALVAMPLLALIIEVREAAPLVALISAIISTVILIRDWRLIHLASTSRLLPASTAGIPLGLVFLTGAGDALMKTLLAVVIMAFAVFNLHRPQLGLLHTDRWAVAFGFVGGVLGGAYNTAGPPLVIYGTLRGWSPEEFRATLQGYFLPISLFIAGAHGLAGLWGHDVVRNFLLALPVIFLATHVGTRLNRRYPALRFARLIYGLLIPIAAMLMATAWMGSD